MKRLSVVVAGLMAVALVAGCAPRYATHSDVNGSGRIKGYYLSDGSYVKVHPVHGTYKVQANGKKKKKKH